METLAIVILSGLCLWFAWRLFSLRKGVESITAALQKDPMPPLRELPPPATQARLEELTKTALNIVAESELTANSEIKKRQFLEALLNEIKDGIFILDSEREIRFLNETARRLFPSEQGHVGRPLFDICRDHRILDSVELAEEVGSKVSDHIMLRVPNGQPDRMKDIMLLIEAEPLSVSGNGESGSWILMRDITSELETEQIRRDFVANASHELRTPLSIINGYLETMEEEDTDLNSAMVRRAVSTMRKHGERIARIVDDMLTISKLENSKDLLTREPFDLRDSLDDMIEQLMPLVEENEAKIKVKADPERPWMLMGDRFYWDQVFFNLIENALKQNKEPGLVIKIRFRKQNGRYLIDIADNGIGIPSADIPLIFKRFYRVQKHHAQGTIKGTGLGLSIVKRAVEAHHGSISVVSRPGLLTKFTISVPETRVTVSQLTGA